VKVISGGGGGGSISAVYCGALPSTEDCLLAFYLEANEI
jgi:hypothetical protein